MSIDGVKIACVLETDDKTVRANLRAKSYTNGARVIKELVEAGTFVRQD